MSKNLFVASDHAGYEYKLTLLKHIPNDILVEDLGTHSSDSVDYPDFADLVCKKVKQDPQSVGLLICGSGQGMAIRANRHRGIRAALCWTSEVAKLAREHNKANILCLPGRMIDLKTGKEILDTFLNTEFEGGRHQRRVDKIESAEGL